MRIRTIKYFEQKIVSNKIKKVLQPQNEIEECNYKIALYFVEKNKNNLAA